MKISSIFCVPAGVDENIYSRVSVNQAYCNVNYYWWSGGLLPHLHHVNHDDWQHKKNEHAYQDRDHTGTFTSFAGVTNVIAHACMGLFSVTVAEVFCVTLTQPVVRSSSRVKESSFSWELFDCKLNSCAAIARECLKDAFRIKK